ncbi:uncharacterized protein DSM5745_05744 [Aspergillus mulundensis]|uniref:Uncharacterized protein n=1 Tax=Aspergillus mulundensis TaxID=1810919 RepID=A0A3D8RXW2_9EURO|nr:hypothetical protein DSM5745_05744 [Aspergillus mulundensis]RDW78892.1 hypothetical protein DSM5745_05744 [Aspergillus mulundensis]
MPESSTTTNISKLAEDIAFIRGLISAQQKVRAAAEAGTCCRLTAEEAKALYEFRQALKEDEKESGEASEKK